MNGELPSLDLAVVTHSPEGIERVAKMILPPVDGINYIISWQDHRDNPIPHVLSERSDVKIFRTDSKGISNNRNNALCHCQSDIVLFSDDDLTYNAEALNELRLLFKENPEVDLFTLKSELNRAKKYPLDTVRLSDPLPSGYSVSSVEISFRRESGRNLRCCPELGIGSPALHGGEDEILLLSAIKKGLDCRFYPLTICSHPHDSTGTKGTMTRGNLMAAGCVIALTYPFSSPLRIPIKVWRVWKSGKAPFWQAFSCIFRGAFMAPGVKRRNRECFW